MASVKKNYKKNFRNNYKKYCWYVLSQVVRAAQHDYAPLYSVKEILNSTIQISPDVVVRCLRKPQSYQPMKKYLSARFPGKLVLKPLVRGMMRIGIKEALASQGLIIGR